MMIDRQHSLPLAKQAKALGISRGTLCYVSRPVLAADLGFPRRELPAEG
jgi:putative transposase